MKCSINLWGSAVFREQQKYIWILKYYMVWNKGAIFGVLCSGVHGELAYEYSVSVSCCVTGTRTLNPYSFSFLTLKHLYQKCSVH